MNVQSIKDVLTFAAFRPEPDDRTASWARRFPRRNTLLVNISRARTTWASVTKAGVVRAGGVADGEFAEVVKQHAEEWRGLTDDGWTAVSLNHRYVISLETNLSRKPEVQEVIRSNPRAVLGAKYERGKRYALTHNPESVASVLLACEEEFIKKIESTLTENRLRAGRITCGVYAMLRRLLEVTNDGREPKTASAAGDKEPRRTAQRLYLACCEGSVCAMLQSGDLWSELRSRSNLYTTDSEPVFSILEPLVARLDAGASVVVAVDSPETGIVAGLREKLPKMNVEDLSGSDHFWRILADLPAAAEMR